MAVPDILSSTIHGRKIISSASFLYDYQVCRIAPGFIHGHYGALGKKMQEHAEIA